MFHPLPDRAAPRARRYHSPPVTPCRKIIFPSVILALQPPTPIPHPDSPTARAIVETGRSRPLAEPAAMQSRSSQLRRRHSEMTLAPPLTRQPIRRRLVAIQSTDSHTLTRNWLCSAENTATPTPCTSLNN